MNLPTKLVAARLPLDLIEALDLESQKTGLNRTSVMIDALRRGLNTAAMPTTSLDRDIMERLEQQGVELWKALSFVNQRLSKLEQVDDLERVDNLKRADDGLAQLELAKRLGVHSSTLTRNRGKSNFIRWTAFKDPEKLAWSYDPKTRRFVNVE